MLQLWSAGLAVAAALLCYAFVAGETVTLFVCGAVFAAAVWTGPGGSRVRSPLSRVVNPTAHRWKPWLAVTFVLLVLATGLGGLAESRGTSWSPGSDRPLSGPTLGQPSQVVAGWTREDHRLHQRDHHSVARRPVDAPTSRTPRGFFISPEQVLNPTERDPMDLHGAFHVYDTTLRDGAQQEGLNLSVADKLTIARQLDGLGVGYIEGGWPGANPKDTEFFRRATTELDLKHAKLAAFGSTRRAGAVAADDPQVAALRDSGASVVTLVAKSHDRHVDLALRTTLEENLAMVRDTVSHLRAEGQQVFLDAEHFFDGYRANRDYALEVLRTAYESGADVVALCDTNGGMLPDWVSDVVHDVIATTGVRVGIHAHNDSGCAVANSLAAIDAGASHVQGCINGYGERTGNADLVSVVANLELKLDRSVLPPGLLGGRPPGSRTRSPRSRTSRPPRGSRTSASSAFAHKAGLHASAIKVDPDLYQHTQPERVGNDMRLLVSDMAGRASIELKGRELGFDLGSDKELLVRVTGAGQGARGDRIHLRGRRRLLRAAAGGDGLRPPAVVLRRRVVAGDHRDA